jgi:hypothetical protein
MLREDGVRMKREGALIHIPLESRHERIKAGGTGQLREKHEKPSSHRMGTREEMVTWSETTREASSKTTSPGLTFFW